MLYRYKMCIKDKKVASMKVALACVSVSFATQVLAFLCPLWLNIETDASLFANFTLNVTQNYFNEYETENLYSLNDNNVEMFDHVNERSVNVSLVATVSRSFGLWYVFTCVDLNCTFGEYPGWDDVTNEIREDYDHGYNLAWIDSKVPVTKQKEYLMEVMLAIMISFVAVVQVWQHKKLYQRDPSETVTEQCHSYRHCAAVSCIVISGGLVWIPFKKYLIVNASFEQYTKDTKGQIINGTEFSHISIGIPYSLMFSGSSLALTTFACMFIVLTMVLRRNGNTISRPNNGVSLDPRLIENVPYRCAVNGSNTVGGVGNSLELQSYSNLPLGAWSEVDRTSRTSTRVNDASVHYPSEGRAEEDPPPSYEEAMRLCVKSDR